MSTEPKDLPKQELLIKLLGMTTSTNDPEALSALRKANSLIKSAGWDWERIIRSKITVIADPFTSLATPSASRFASAPNPPSPTYPGAYTQAPPPSSAPPPPPLMGTPAKPLSTRENAFAGHCHCCGIEVVAKAGTIFQSHNSASWKIVCSTCNISAVVQRHAAQRRKRGKKSLTDLA